MEFESTVNAEPVVNVEPQTEVQTEQTPDSSVNVEVAEPQQEKPVQSQEENAKYAAIRREAESKARDKTIADMGMEWNGQKITTYDQYVRAKAESEEQQRKAELKERGIDPTVIDDYINNNPTVKKSKEIIAEQERQQRQAEEYGEFLQYFKAENGRGYNPESDSVPDEVWLMTAEKNPDGTPNTKRKTLADAYAYHANKQLKAKLAEYEAKLKAQETNEKNAASSPGSVTGNGEIKGDFVSFETFEANKNDRNWVMKNYSKIVSSRSQW